MSNASKTSFGNGLTPTYWSASQLLKEHEERQQRETLARDTVSPINIDQLQQQHPQPTYGYNGDIYGQQQPQQAQYGGGGYYNGAMDPGYQIQAANDPYYTGYMIDEPQHQRFSTAESAASGGVNGVYPNYPGYHPMPENQFNVTLDGSSDTDSTIVRNNNNRNGGLNGLKAGVPKNSGSDSSAATLGLANPSLQGSLLSLANGNGRPPSTQSKTRNITQV